MPYSAPSAVLRVKIHAARLGEGRGPDRGALSAEAASPDAGRKFITEAFDSLETFTGCTTASLGEQPLAAGPTWTFRAAAPKLCRRRCWWSRPTTAMRVRARLWQGGCGAGAPQPQTVHFATDHPYSDHRSALQQTVVDWLPRMQ